MRDLNQTVWTEGELDEALGLLHADERTARVPLNALRATVLGAVDQPPLLHAISPAVPTERRRFPKRTPVLVAAAAAVALLAAGVFAIQGGLEQQPTAAPSPATHAGGVELLSARQVLASAANLAIKSTDVPLRPGQFRYVDEHGWEELTEQHADGGGFSYLREETIQTWIPADYHTDWRERRTLTGKKQWLGGTEPQSVLSQPEPDADIQNADRTAACGNFFPQSQGTHVCGDPTDIGSPAFYQQLPTSTAQMLTKLKQEAAPKGGTPSEILHIADAMLQTGLAPAAVRAAMYRALAELPGIQITDRTANLAGATGVALGIDDGSSMREDVIIDPNTGEYIGDRQIAIHPDQKWVKPGTVIGFTSQTMSVVDSIRSTR
jgi:hypothetical protein